MASRSHGYYGLGGSSKSADFGLAANMTLPMTKPKGEVEHSASGYDTMPGETKKSKKKARFSVDLDSEEPQPSGGVVMRSNSARVGWRQRLSGLFRRNSKLEKYDSPDPIAVVPVTEVPTRTVDDSEVDKQKARRKKRKKRDTKSRSTAFEEFTDLPYLLNDNESTDFLKLAIRPKTASSEFGDMRVTLRRKTDGFGIHLSGGLPPISITYVQPGSEAESARIMVGDIVTEVNGHDCRKGVGISRIMELKSLIQQTTSEHTEPAADDGVWEKIKEKQVELESDNSEDGEITRIDSSTESEEEQTPPKPEPPKQPEVVRSSTPKKSSLKKKSDHHLSPEPLATPEPSPVKQLPADESPGLVTVGVIKKSRSKKRTKERRAETSLADQSASFSAEGLGDVQPSESLKKKKKKVSREANDHTSPVRASLADQSAMSAEGLGDVQPSESLKKKKKKVSREADDHPSPVRASLADQSASFNGDGLDNEQASESLKKKKKKKVSSEADDSALLDEPKQKKKRKSKQGEDTAAANGADRSIERPKKKRPKSGDIGSEETDMPRKTRSPRDSDSLKKRRSRDPESRDSPPADDTPKRKSADGHKKKTNDDKPKAKRKKKRDGESKKHLSPSNSKVKNAHEESDDLQYVDYGGPDDDLLAPITSEKRSSSYHDLDKEDRKLYREELRQASQSEQRTNGQLDIDPDVRVMKSGKVVGKRKTNDRPSIFGAEVDSKENTDLADQERKTSMDLAAVPRTSPSLGLEHGHEKLDVISRSLSKRRPASDRKSLLLKSGKDVMMGSERVDLSDKSNGTKGTRAAADVNQPVPRPRKQSIVEYMESLHKSKYTSLTRPAQSPVPANTLVEESSNLTPDVAKRIFEKPAESSPVVKRDPASLLMAFNKSSTRNKTVDQPVKKLGLASETSEPSWVALAKNKTNAMNGSNDKSSEGKSPARELEFPTMAREQDISVNMGTVQARLAMFQKFK